MQRRTDGKELNLFRKIRHEKDQVTHNYRFAIEFK